MPMARLMRLSFVVISIGSLSAVYGLYPNGSTGEFTRFTADERKRIIKIVCDQANGRVPVLAGAAEANVTETIRACETYAEYGA